MAATENLIFFGTADLSAAVLRALVEAGYNVVAAVSQPDRPGGRGKPVRATPVKLAAQALRLACWQPPRVRDGLPDMMAARPVAGVLYAYGQLLPPEVLKIFPRGILNLHPSLLPRYRGPSPVPQAILDGARDTGVSIIRLDNQLDHGPLMAQVSTPIGPTETASELLARLVKLGIALLLEVLPRYLRGGVTLTAQVDRDCSFTRKILRDDGRIAWNQPSELIFRQYRALQPWPGIFTFWQGIRVKLTRITPAAVAVNGAPGTVSARGPRVRVACGQGAVVIHDLQAEGKKVMTVAEFLLGHPAFARAQLG